MGKRLPRVLILDTDPDTLLTLQHVLERAELDTTITWDEIEARHLVQTKAFDLILIGDHPPELDAVMILDDLRFQCASCPSLVLEGIVREQDVELFRGLGAIGVVPKHDCIAVLEQVTKALAPLRFKVVSARAGLAEVRSLRAAS